LHDRRHLGLVMYRAGTDVVAKAAFFVITVAAARTLPPQAFGLFALASTVGWIAAVAADFGIQMHLARAVAQHPDAAGHLLRRWLPVRTLTAILGVVAITAGAVVALPTWAAARVLVLLTLTYALNGLSEFIYYFFRAISRSDLESTFVVAQRLALLALALSVLAWAPGLEALAVAMLVPAAVTLSIAIAVARRLSRSSAASDVPNAGAFRAEAIEHVLPIGAGIVLSALYFRIDIFLIGAWLGPEAAGAYNAVFRIVEALRLMPAAALAVTLPLLFAAATRRPLVQLASTLAIAAGIVAAMLWSMAPWLVARVYGPEYAAAAPALRVLALAFPLMAVNYALTHQLIGWHGHRRYAWLCAAALVVNIGANTVAIPALGITGAAWTTLLTELAVTILCVSALTTVERRGLASPAIAVPR
jgi:O-antigen/teichoic acid export membrane protein